MTSVGHPTLQNMSVLPVGMYVTFIMWAWIPSVIFVFWLVHPENKTCFRIYK